LHALVFFRIATIAAHRLAEDRKSGALELLMATPLEVRRIVRGQWLALARQMVAPILILVLTQAFFFWSLMELFVVGEGRQLGINSPWQFIEAVWSGNPRLQGEMVSVMRFMALVIAALTVLVVVSWITLGWVGMWMAIRVKHPRTAPWAALALVLIPPWPVYGVILYWLDHISSFWNEFEYVFLCLQIGFGLGLLHTAILSAWAWRKLRRHFRVAVTDRFLFVNMRWTWRQRALLAARFALGGVSLFILLVAWHKVENWRGQRAWTKFQAEMQAKGENLDLNAVLPARVPDDQNFAAAPVWEPVFGFVASTNKAQALAKRRTLNTLETVNLEGQPQGWMGYSYGNQPRGNWREQMPANLTNLQKHFRARTQFPKPLLTNAEPAADILTALDKFQVELDEFREAGQRPFCRFPIDHYPASQRYSVTHHLDILHNVGEVLQVRASALLALGKSDEAMSDVALILRFAEALRLEPFVQSQRIRHHLIGFAIQPIWEGLASRHWSKEHIEAIEKQFQRFDLLADYQKTIRGETLLQMDAWNRFRLMMSGDLSQSDGHEMRRLHMKPFYPSGRAYHHQIAVYHFYEGSLVPAIDPKQQRIFMNKAELVQRELETTGVFMNNRTAHQTIGGFAQDSARLQTGVNQTMLACALEHYRQAHGQYPETLNMLTTQFLGTISHDPISGGQLHYRRTADGQFVLYSVGPNEKDDRGIERNEVDWVWRYPSK